MSNSAHDERDVQFMSRTLELAQKGQGLVEPNPMVGCVIVKDNQVIAEGFHRKYGGDHAEVDAIKNASQSVSGSTLYVNLEPCSHHGKTGPCATAIIDSKVAKVVIAMQDPFEKVAGRGIEMLRQAGVEVEIGVLESSARNLNAPFIKYVTEHQPWLIAKWAMTLDGKIATSTGDSKWISNEQSRAIVHQIRARVDGIITGSGTVLADDPMLNARTEKVSRVAKRIVIDSKAKLPIDSKLVRSAKEIPVIIVADSKIATDGKLSSLRSSGVEVLDLPKNEQRLPSLLKVLAVEYQMTNILLEAGGNLLGECFDAKVVDESHIFIGNKIVGGSAKSPVEGNGVAKMAEAIQLESQTMQTIGSDIYIQGRVAR